MSLPNQIYLTVLSFLKLLFLAGSSNSQWATILVWILRIATASFLFRTFLGPYVLRLVSSRLRVRSVSLRSIRGIYFRAGSGILRVDRIGLSYHRPSLQSASRFSIVVQGLKIEVACGEHKTSVSPSSSAVPRHNLPRPGGRTPSLIAHRAWSAIPSVCSWLYSSLDPYLRPIVRATIVAALRLAIRALPALTQVLDFELESATVTFATIPGAEIKVEQAILRTSIVLSSLSDKSRCDGMPSNPPRHRRFGSVADWNIRLKSSLRRTWDRAWGVTEVAGSVSLNVKEIVGTMHGSLAKRFKVPPLKSTNANIFLKLPGIAFSVSASFNPQLGVEQHSLDITLGLEPVDLDVDVFRYILNALKNEQTANGKKSQFEPPQSPALSQSSVLSPRASWVSPLSTNSALIDAVSASVRFRWNVKQRAAQRRNSSPKLSILRAIRLDVPCLNLINRLDSQVNYAQTFHATFKCISIGFGLSHPDRNPLHRDWLGRTAAPGDALTSDVYSFDLSVQQLALDRVGSGAIRDHLRVLVLGPISTAIIISQWPSPWLHGSRFLTGDPNAQLLVVQISLGKIEMTERLEVIHALLDRGVPTQSPEPRPLFPAVLSPVPRVAIDFQADDICTRFILLDPHGGQGPFAFEARTEGFILSARSDFVTLSDRKFNRGLAIHDHPRLLMNFNINIELQRMFVNVFVGAGVDDAPSPTMPSAYPGEPIFSLESVQVNGNGHALGDVVDEADSYVTIDVQSTYLDLPCWTDALSVELWQPDTIAALTTLAVLFGTRPNKVPTAPTARLLDRLPPGLSASFTVARLMLFVTGSDLAPDEELNISRGVASHMGFTLHYCALRDGHSERMTGLGSRTQKRLQLSLPNELVSKVAGGATAIATTQTIRSMMHATVWDIALRDALATRFVADDPYGVGDVNEGYRSKEHLRIKSITADIVLSGYRQNGSSRPDSLDSCQIYIHVSSIRGSLHLAHAYNLLLAVQTIKVLSPATDAPKQPPGGSAAMTTHLRCVVDNVHLLCEFPLRAKLHTRITSFAVQVSPARKIHAQWENIALAAAVDVERDGSTHVDWEEVLRLPDWKIQIQPNVSPVAILAEGHGARLRIPFGFVPADLILDINVSIKCVKHLLRVVPAGHFTHPPAPEAEDAKEMPDLTVRIGCLTVEAADELIESRLGLIMRAGFEASRLRMEREEAFDAKVATILAAADRDSHAHPRSFQSDFQFTSEHSISVADARERLSYVHSGAWQSHLRQARDQQRRREEAHTQKILGNNLLDSNDKHDVICIKPPPPVPPLCRVVLDQLSLHLTIPSFPFSDIPDFLYVEGGGMPRDTQYSLLVPLHLNFTVASLRVAYREYPLPLLNISPHSDRTIPGLEFDSDIVIAEEMGTDQSVEWIDCAIVKPHTGVYGASPLHVAVPKTIMPVKSYANPVIRVRSDRATDFAWGVSYGPATQDVMRVIDALSHAPHDDSPAIGFWDKLRLVFHWRLRVQFENEIHLHMKGSYDPYDLRDAGAGFALCWQGNPQILINQENQQNEVIQVKSDSMLVVIPNVEESYGETNAGAEGSPLPSSRNFQKICAKLTSGVSFGVGVALERSCGPECLGCTGRPFQRRCRFFNFRPHYEVKLEQKETTPEQKSAEDSYNGFRSDFIHLSISLTSSLHTGQAQTFSSIHLSPKVFAHFWAWWQLFDGKSLPIRQGRRYEHKRPISPKFGQHLATIKYRISVDKLFMSHVYMDDSKDAWTDGVTPFVGVKAMIDKFRADMHQRAQECTITTPDGGVKTIVHKPFYAVEVVLRDIEMRTLLAIFAEPLKQCVLLDSTPLGCKYRTRENIPEVGPNSAWMDLDDFTEADWSTDGIPTLHLLPMVSCPQFTYFRRAWEKESTPSEDRVEISKFGTEDTHVCLLGKEASIPQVQADLASKRILELRKQSSQNVGVFDRGDSKSTAHANQMISLLEDYIHHLTQVDAASKTSSTNGTRNYYMPSDSVSPEEWAEFDSVYQVHCPQIYMDNAIRDIMLQYYKCSRARRGIEYHMATRAVEFIREQAKAAISSIQSESEKSRGPAASAQAAAMAVRKILTGDTGGKTSVEISQEPLSDDLGGHNPLSGWPEGVSLSKGHFCLLLKPQIVLRSEVNAESACILAAVQGKLQTYGIMDVANADDPVSGKIMTRNFASLTGLQTFSLSAANKAGEGCVPLEVLIDLRCASPLFDRLVPQTDAALHYDKFNRLRLRNNVTSVIRAGDESDPMHNHLLHHTDLIRFHVPRFTVSANDRHFQAISHILTDLLLFSDAALQTQSEKLEKLLFSYDFTNLSSAADVVADMQSRLRRVVEMRREAEWKLQGYGDSGQVEKLKIDAHILLLAEELNLVFDAIKLAQDKAEDRSSEKSALLLHASSSEISWNMLDRSDQLLSKLAVRDIDFYWLNRQDSSTVNNLSIGDLQAFDGAADAEWTEILSKYDEPSSHPLVKRNIFLLADWTVLPPVGGIAIYEAFELVFHPMRLQIDSRMGRKIMEYVWPARRTRKEIAYDEPEVESTPDIQWLSGPSTPAPPDTPRRRSTDAITPTRRSLDSGRLAPPSLRRLNTSRSFTDLRNTAMETLRAPRLQKTRSSDALLALSASQSSGGLVSKGSDDSKERFPPSRGEGRPRDSDDAAVMKTRSSQKTFVWVRVASLHVLLSIRKEDSFVFRDARIRTRDLEYRNQTSSLEELVEQFIPSGRNWKGWVKMAFQQPLVPVIPVAREIISKTKWGALKENHSSEAPKRIASPRMLSFMSSRPSRSNSRKMDRGQGTASNASLNSFPKEESIAGLGLTAEADSIPTGLPPDEPHRSSRARVLSVFKRRRASSKPRSSIDSNASKRSNSTRTSGEQHSTSDLAPPIPSSHTNVESSI